MATVIALKDVKILVARKTGSVRQTFPEEGQGRPFRRLLSGRCLGLGHTETVQQHIREESHAYVQRGEAGSS